MSQPPRVLFVEDEADLRVIVGDALGSLGFDVVTARNGAEALERLREGAAFDHVISDVSMPEGVSGIDLAGHVAALQPQARMILVSGYMKAQLPPLPENVRFLPKPYRLGQLLGALEGL